MSPRLVLSIVVLAAWAGAPWGALSIARVPGDWGHAVCGPWGCAPPLQALVGCHLAWLVLLAPVAVVGPRIGRLPWLPGRAVGAAFVFVAVAGAFAVWRHERATWLAAASEPQREYFWQRCALAIAAWVDAPLVQLLLVGVLLIVRACVKQAPRPRASVNPTNP